MKYFGITEVDVEDNKSIIGDVDYTRYNYEGSEKDINTIERFTTWDLDFYKSKKIDFIDFIDFDPNNVFTDFIFGSALPSNGFIVSNKVRLLMLKYRLLQIQFIPIVNSKIPSNSFFFMFFNSDMTDRINYDKTKFYYRNILNNSFTPIVNIKNRNDLIETCKNSVYNIIEVITVKKIFFYGSIDYDVFRIGRFSDSYYFSKRIIDDLIQNNLTAGARIYSSFNLVNKEYDNETVFDFNS